MAALAHMPQVVIPVEELHPFAERWQEKQSLPRTPPCSSSQLGLVFDRRVGEALAAMLGGVQRR